MSWGLQFYEENDLVNRAHFPEYMPSQNSDRSERDTRIVMRASEGEPRTEVVNWGASNIEHEQA